MKRKLEVGMAEDGGWSTPPPTKRMSMLHNTPKQWKEQRRRLLTLSKQKLKCIVDVDTNLRKSVLINNTYRKIKHDLKYCSASPPDTYTPRPVFASSRRRLMMSQAEWEREVDAMETQEDDIESKTLSPPPKDLSQVLSDILGEDVDKSCDQTGGETENCEKTAKDTFVAMDASTDSMEGGPCVSGNQAEFESDQTEALNLSVSGTRAGAERQVDCDSASCDKLAQRATTTEPRTSEEERRDMDQISSSQDDLERSHESQSDIGGSPDDLKRSEVRALPEEMDCESSSRDLVTRSLPRSGDPDHMTSGGREEISVVLTTNALEDFVISPRVSQWKQMAGESSLTSLTLFPMFDLPMVPCPSLQTSSFIPKLLHIPESSSPGAIRTSETEDSRYHGNYPSDCTTSSRITDGCGQTGSDSIDAETEHSREESCPCADPAESLGGAYDTDSNQQLWACFQQFNMAIACS